MATYQQRHFLADLKIEFADTNPFDPCSDTSSVHIDENSTSPQVNPSIQPELFSESGEANFESHYWGEFAPKH
jgi:hypothetical protein